MIPTAAHRSALVISVVIWTWLLWKPNPIPEFVARSLLEDLKYFLGKSLHFAVFAALAWYATFRVAPSRWRWIWLACLAYAVITEIGQYLGDYWFQTHRTGTVKDVLIDSGGVLAGATLRHFNAQKRNHPRPDSMTDSRS